MRRSVTYILVLSLLAFETGCYSYTWVDTNHPSAKQETIESVVLTSGTRIDFDNIDKSARYVKMDTLEIVRGINKSNRHLESINFKSIQTLQLREFDFWTSSLVLVGTGTIVGAIIVAVAAGRGAQKALR